MVVLLLLTTRPWIRVNAPDDEEDEEELERDVDVVRRKKRVPVRIKRRHHTGVTPPA